MNHPSNNQKMAKQECPLDFFSATKKHQLALLVPLTDRKDRFLSPSYFSTSEIPTLLSA